MSPKDPILAPRPALTEPTPEWLDALEARLGPQGVRRRDAVDAYLDEPRGRFRGKAALVARPRDVDGVAAVVRACADARVGLVPWGGGTGLVGGQTALDGPTPILLSLERLNRVRGVSAEDDTLTVDAGVTLAAAREAAAEAGRLFPLSLASEGTCQIGGVLAANAGGVAVLRYGNARELCLGVEAVLADGSVLRGLTGLRKDNTGFDLRHLLIGSEGALGVITGATLKLYPQPAERAVALAALHSVEDAITLLRRLQGALGETVSAFELLSAQAFAFLREAEMETGPPPLDPTPPFAALVEIGGRGARDGLEATLAVALEEGLVTDAAVAANEAQRAALWRLREAIPSANRRIGAVASHDIAVPIARIPAFLREAEAALRRRAPQLRINAFGHLGDGNLHYNLFPPAGRAREDFAEIRDDATRIVHDLVHAHRGSISAEHGIGRLKVADLARYADPTKLSAMRAIKAALDPAGVLNPGVLGL
ncbi:MAG: FAD-binding oxidoreductase [Pseudomonadota bacterium]